MRSALTKNVVVAVFTELLGEPTKVLQKIVGWHISPGRDLVVQLESRQAADRVYVWLPANENGITPIDCPCDLYAAGKTRHHNVAGFKSLAANRWALRFRPMGEEDLILIAKPLTKKVSARA